VHHSVRRDRWLNNPVFVLASVGSAIGLGNFWKFPYLTFKHGGWWFIAGYACALFVCGIPMLILELTLGQKNATRKCWSYEGYYPKTRRSRMGCFSFQFLCRNGLQYPHWTLTRLLGFRKLSTLVCRQFQTDYGMQHRSFKTVNYF